MVPQFCPPFPGFSMPTMPTAVFIKCLLNEKVYDENFSINSIWYFTKQGLLKAKIVFIRRIRPKS